MAGNITDESRVPEILAKMDDIASQQLLVGIIGEGDKYPDSDVTVLDVANIHEYGVTGTDVNGRNMNIPERSFIRASYDKNLDEIMDYSSFLISKVVEEDMSTKSYMIAMGERGQEITQTYLRNLDHPPLKPATIKAKGSSSVLIDKGQLMEFIKYEVLR